MIDTSALRPLLEDDRQLLEFASLLRQTKRELFVSTLTLLELYAYKDSGAREKQLRALGRIFSTLRGRIFFAAELQDVIKSEFRTKRFHKPKRMPHSEQMATVEHLGSSSGVAKLVRFYDAAAENALKTKQDITSFQREMPARKAEEVPDFNDESFYRMLESCGKPPSHDKSLEKLLGFTPPPALQIFNSHGRFLTYRAFHQMEWLQTAATCIDRTPTSSASGRPLTALFRSRAGDSYDNSIAATAAYCDLLVAKDRNLVRRWNHVFLRGRVDFACVLPSDLRSHLMG